MPKSSHGRFFQEYLEFCRTKELLHFSPESFHAWDEALKAEHYSQKQIEAMIAFVRRE